MLTGRYVCFIFTYKPYCETCLSSLGKMTWYHVHGMQAAQSGPHTICADIGHFSEFRAMSDTLRASAG